MIRVAAIGDVHFSEDSVGRLRPHWERLSERADLLLLAGDLTKHGAPSEAAAVAEELEAVELPKFAVLGNHDVHGEATAAVRHELERRGVVVLEGESTTLSIGGESLGIVGAKGFCGGFAGACATAFGEPEMKAFVRSTASTAASLHVKIAALRTDYRVVLLHYSPVPDTLEGERLEIYPFLGSYLLAEAIDDAGADLALHGHAHQGKEKGITPGGVPVRNVALPVLRQAYAVYELSSSAKHD